MNIRCSDVPNAIIFITQVVDYRMHVFQNQASLELWKTIRRA